MKTISNLQYFRLINDVIRLSILLLVFSCGNKSDLNDNVIFPRDYLKELNNAKSISIDDDFYLFLPIGSCSSCVYETFELIKELHAFDNVHICMMGDYKKDFIEFKDWLKSNENSILIDDDALYKKHSLSFHTPVLYYYKNNKLQKYHEITLANINIIKNEIHTLLGNN